MKQYAGKQPDLHHADDEVAAHEMRPVIKGLPVIIKVDHGIEPAMHNQKTDQKNSGESHDQFFSNGRGKEMFPGHMQDLKGVIGLQKYATIVAKKKNFTLVWRPPSDHVQQLYL